MCWAVGKKTDSPLFNASFGSKSVQKVAKCSNFFILPKLGYKIPNLYLQARLDSFFQKVAKCPKFLEFWRDLNTAVVFWWNRQPVSSKSRLIILIKKTSKQGTRNTHTHTHTQAENQVMNLWEVGIYSSFTNYVLNARTYDNTKVSVACLSGKLLTKK